MEPKQNLLSLCVIAKNEEENIEACFKNWRLFADEAIMVDTGSTDQTIQLAKKSGVTVYKKKFTNSFSSIRNYAISKAKGKWILFLDADESLNDSDAKKIIQLLKNPNVEGYLFYLNTFLNNQEPTQVQAMRLFRNREEYRYQNKAYEKIPEDILTNIKNSDLAITHRPNPDRYPNIQEQKYLLLQNDLAENPTDPYLLYVYGLELLNRNKPEQSVASFKKAVQKTSRNHIFATHLHELLIYSLLELQQFKEAAAIADHGIKLFPFNASLIFLRSQAYKEALLFHEALKDLEQCLQLDKANSLSTKEQEINSPKTLMAIGEIHELLLNYQLAKQYYLQAYSSEKSFEEPLYKLGSLLKKNPSLGEIDEVVTQQIDGKDAEQLLTLIDILVLEQEYPKALQYTEELIKLVGRREDVIFMQGISQMMLGNFPEADKLFLTIDSSHPLSGQVILRRIQNCWISRKWSLAGSLLNNIADYTVSAASKRVYPFVHALLLGEEIENNNLQEKDNPVISKLLENLLYMGLNEQADPLLNFLLAAKDEKLLEKPALIFAEKNQIEKLYKLLAQVQNPYLRSQLCEKTAQIFFNKQQFSAAEEVLRQAEPAKMGPSGYLLLSEISLIKAQVVLQDGLNARILKKEEKKELSTIMELINNEA